MDVGLTAAFMPFSVLRNVVLTVITTQTVDLLFG